MVEIVNIVSLSEMLNNIAIFCEMSEFIHLHSELRLELVSYIANDCYAVEKLMQLNAKD